MVAIEKGKSRILKITAIAFGFSLYWAWINIFAFSDALYQSSSDSNLLSQYGGIAFMVGNAAAMLVSANAPASFFPFSRHRLFGPAIFTVFVIALLFSSFADAQTSSGILVCISGAFCAGIGSASLLLLWGESLGTLGAKKAGLAITSSFIAGIALYGLILLIPSPIKGVSVAVLLGASLFLARKMGMSAPALVEPVNDNDNWKYGNWKIEIPLPWKLVLGGFVYGILGSLVRNATSFTDTAAFQQSNDAAIAARLLICALLLLGLLVFGKNLDRGFTYRPTIPIIALGCLIIPFLDASHAPIVAAVAHSGYVYYLLFSLVAYSDIMFRSGQPARKVFGWGRFADSAGFLVGAGASIFLGAGITEQGYFYMAVSALGILLITLVPVLILTDGNVVEVDYARSIPQANGEESSKDGQATFDSRCDEVADRYGLTAREREVFGYLAQGRSLPFIEKTIFISHNTAKTHVQNIYRKTLVHSRQELIDLVQGKKDI